MLFEHKSFRARNGALNAVRVERGGTSPPTSQTLKRLLSRCARLGRAQGRQTLQPSAHESRGPRYTMLFEYKSFRARSSALNAVRVERGRYVASYLTDHQTASVALYAARASLRPPDTAALGSRELRAAINDDARPYEL